VLLKACLNGARAPGSHPALPLTPDALAADARRCVDAGAGALHVHPRDAAGHESLAPEHIAAALHAIHAVCPGVPVGVSTGAWIVPLLAERLALIAAWAEGTELPDFASVNFVEAGALQVCEVLLTGGIGIEAGLSTSVDALWLRDSGIAPRCLRVLIEPDEDDPAAALATAAAIIAVLDAADIHLPRLLHGVDAAAWPLLDAAYNRGYDARIGLEDTLTMPDGTPVPNNAALIAAAHALAARH